MTTLKNLVDETTNIKNELVTCHSNLKANLIEKGIEVAPEAKMSSLINMVENIITEQHFLPEWGKSLSTRIEGTRYSYQYLAEMTSSATGDKIYYKGADGGYAHRVLEYNVFTDTYNEISSLSSVDTLLWYDKNTLFGTSSSRGYLYKIDLTTKTSKEISNTSLSYTHLSAIIGDKLYAVNLQSNGYGVYEFNITTSTWSKISSAKPDPIRKLFAIGNDLYAFYYTNSTSFTLRKYNFNTNVFDLVKTFSVSATIPSGIKGEYLNSKANKIYFLTLSNIYEVDFEQETYSLVADRLPINSNNGIRLLFEKQNKVVYSLGESSGSYLINIKGVDF